MLKTTNDMRIIQMALKIVFDFIFYYRQRGKNENLLSF